MQQRRFVQRNRRISWVFAHANIGPDRHRGRPPPGICHRERKSANSAPAFQRAARIGDGFQFGAAGPAIRAQWQLVKEALAKADRPVDGFGAEITVDFSHGPDIWRTELEAWQEAGGTHFSLRAMDTAAELVGAKHVGYKSPHDYIDALEQFAKVVV